MFAGISSMFASADEGATADGGTTTTTTTTSITYNNYLIAELCTRIFIIYIRIGCWYNC